MNTYPLGLRPFGLKCISICYINYSRKLPRCLFPQQYNVSFSPSHGFHIHHFHRPVHNLCRWKTSQPKQSSLINLGTSLTYPTSWLSPSSQFAFGFYQQGRGFAVGVWFIGKDNTTVDWTENRDDPPVTSKSMLDFTRDSKILLRTEQGQKQLIVTSATDPVSYAAMLDTGNFVLYDKDSKIRLYSLEGNCSLV